MIRRIAISADGTLLATASDDKTLRLWDGQTGRLNKTIRPPIGKGHEGKLFAVALSPDGRTVAAGGWSGYEWDNKSSIYLFDTASGRMIRRLPGIGNGVFDLDFSPDGIHLAAVLGSGGGLRILRLVDGRLVKKDNDYSAHSLDVDFASDGRLVTTCYDGYIRLYGADFKLLEKKAAPGGNQPYSARFSPDGEEVAVGFRDSTKVDIISATTLNHRYSPDNSGTNIGNISIVTWSSNGRYLFAGGKWGKGGTNPIRRWQKRGRGSYKDISLVGSTIMDLRARPDGGFFLVLLTRP
jgi:WD40 repeat protein